MPYGHGSLGTTTSRRVRSVCNIYIPGAHGLGCTCRPTPRLSLMYLNLLSRHINYMCRCTQVISDFSTDKMYEHMMGYHIVHRGDSISLMFTESQDFDKLLSCGNE